MSRILGPFSQFFDGDGDPLSQGWLKFTESGTNLTDRDTFADDNLQIANTNPLQLDSEGRCPNVFGTGSYRVTLFAYNPADPYNVGTQIDQKDPVSESASGSVTFGIWDTTEIYDAGAIVIGSDGNYYKSLSSANEANDPISTPSKWERIDYSHFYNAGISYDIADRVIDAATGIVYISLVDTNLNNTPSSSPTKWIDQVKLNQDAITAIALRVTQNETDIGLNTSFRVTPSTVIAAGDKLSWTGNTLNVVEDTWGAWQTPTGLSSRWSLYSTGDYGELRFRKSSDGKLLQLRGALEATASPELIVFTLPVGYRPTYISSTSVGTPEGVTNYQRISSVNIGIDGVLEINERSEVIYNFNIIIAID